MERTKLIFSKWNLHSKKILDSFGNLLVEEVFDTAYGSIIEVMDGTCPNVLKKELTNIFSKLDYNQKKKIVSYMYDLISGSLFDFLRVFEENEEFKLFYEKDGQQVNLVEISEMLKAEPIIENGWIERFSKELNKEEKA